MSKIIKLYLFQFILTAALLCTISIGGEYFYAPVIAGIAASICFYYTAKETIKKLEEVKEYNVKKHEEERKFYAHIIDNTEMIAKENSNTINELRKTIDNILESIEKNHTILADKISNEIIKVEKEIAEQHDYVKKANRELHDEVKDFRTDYNEESKNNLKVISNDIKHYTSKIREEMNCDNKKLLEMLMDNKNSNEEIMNSNFSDLIKILEENNNEIKEAFDSKVEHNMKQISGKLRRLLENTVNVQMRLDDIREMTSENIKQLCESLKNEISNNNKRVIDTLEDQKKSSAEELSKIALKMDNITADMKTENNLDEAYNEGDQSEFENENGIDCFINDKLVRHEDPDGSITEFEYDGEHIKQSTTRKNGNIIKQCSYVNGVLTEGKLFEDGQVKEEYLYDENGEVVQK